MTGVSIILLSIVTAVAYGILHDLVTAHVCLEYFTVAHPPILPSQSPVVMAFLWGVLATWWVGLIMALAAFLGGLVGYAASRWGWIWLIPPFSEQIPRAHWHAFFFDAFAHTGSYGVGLVGGGLIILKTWRSRTPASSDE